MFWRARLRTATGGLAVTAVVWFKRDLRIRDHQPLSAAADAGPVIPLYIHEPDLINAPDWAAQHSAFARECLDSLNRSLTERGAPLIERIGNAVDVLDELHTLHQFTTLYSHEETGNALSYGRDRAVRKWCVSAGVRWIQTPQNGVIRGASEARKKRDWLAEMEEYSSSEPVKAPRAIEAAIATVVTPSAQSIPCGAGIDKTLRLRGGREAAIAALTDFFTQKVRRYPKSVSSPLSAEKGCSRLSPYLSFGVLSVREIVLAINRRLQSPDLVQESPTRDHMINVMRFYADRLKWRSGYLQNLENMPSLEHDNIDPQMDGLREREFDAVKFAAWKEGRTGYPMVDASMRMLIATGWLNMRMRGMLMSFAANELWLHWREPGVYLAQQFLDYEPGIHYNQLQIHSCTAGSTHFLSYNPVKQARDLDADGTFVRRWNPELANVPSAFIFEPWLMPADVQIACGVVIGTNYPTPIVDHVAAGRRARDRISAARNGSTLGMSSRRIDTENNKANNTANGDAIQSSLI